MYITFPDESNPPMKDTVEAELIGSQREFLQGDVERMVDTRRTAFRTHDLRRGFASFVFFSFSLWLASVTWLLFLCCFSDGPDRKRRFLPA